MDIRVATLVVGKSGGARGGSSTFRATLPTKWVREMGLGEDERDIELVFDEGNKEIVIRKRS